MKFGEVFDFRTAEEAKAFLGKKGAFSDNLKRLIEHPTLTFVGTFKNVVKGDACPFYGNGIVSYQFFRPVLEEEVERMSNRQLAEWLAKGNGEYAYNNGWNATTTYNYKRTAGDDPVEEGIIIRRWNDSRWVKPTKSIYEEDCKTNIAVNEEDCK